MYVCDLFLSKRFHLRLKSLVSICVKFFYQNVLHCIKLKYCNVISIFSVYLQKKCDFVNTILINMASCKQCDRKFNDREDKIPCCDFCNSVFHFACVAKANNQDKTPFWKQWLIFQIYNGIATIAYNILSNVVIWAN